MAGRLRVAGVRLAEDTVFMELTGVDFRLCAPVTSIAVEDLLFWHEIASQAARSGKRGRREQLGWVVAAQRSREAKHEHSSCASEGTRKPRSRTRGAT